MHAYYALFTLSIFMNLKNHHQALFLVETYEYEIQSICSQISSLGSAIIDNSLTCSISDSC